MNRQPEPDRVRAHSPERANQRIDNEIKQRIASFARRERSEITRRIGELDREWDMERLLEMNASTLAFLGLALGVTQSKKWLFLPGVVLPFLFQHAIQGWCPPIPILRRLGVRTRGEIDREKYAMKALRGDFGFEAGPMEAEMAAR